VLTLLAPIDLQNVLVDLGAVRHGDPRLHQLDGRSGEDASSSKIRQGTTNREAADDDDSDWD
jgi:hypothetical protein